MKILISSLLNLFCLFIAPSTIKSEPLNTYLLSTEQSKNYISPNYGYSIVIPEGFKIERASVKNIDLKMINDKGQSILVNVSHRLPQEYSITAHDYTAQFLENSIRPNNPGFKIIKWGKIYLSGERTFLIYYTNSSENIKAIECYIYYKDSAYVLTATSNMNDFSAYEKVFLTTINTLKLNK